MGRILSHRDRRAKKKIVYRERQSIFGAKPHRWDLTSRFQGYSKEIYLHGYPRNRHVHQEWNAILHTPTSWLVKLISFQDLAFGQGDASSNDITIASRPIRTSWDRWCFAGRAHQENRGASRRLVHCLAGGQELSGRDPKRIRLGFEFSEAA